MYFDVDLMRNTIKDFILEKCVDKKNDGLFSVLESDGNKILCDDKQLLDHLFVMLAFLSSDESTIFSRADERIKILEKFKDPSFFGFFEITDRDWNLHEIGSVKTTSIQLLAAYVQVLMGLDFKEDSIFQAGVELFDQCMKFLTPQGLPRVLDREWKYSLDNRFDLEATSIAVIILVELSKKEDIYDDLFKSALKALDCFIDTNLGGAFCMISSDEKPIVVQGKTLKSMSFASFALVQAGIFLNNNALLNKAERILSFIDEKLKDKIYGGFWNFCNVQGSVLLNVSELPYKNESFFPAKLAYDHSILLLALLEIQEVNDNKNHIAMLNETLKVIQNLHDLKYGGIFLGESNWWAAPEEPTVPLIRLFWTPRFTPGSFHVGNLSYLPLQEKQTRIQAAVLWALSHRRGLKNRVFEYQEAGLSDDATTEDPVIEIRDGVTKALSYDLKKILIKQDVQPKINIEKYIEWLKLTRIKGGTFGLTPYVSPLGCRADRASQVFSTHHAVADLMVLQQEIEDQHSVIRTLQACQNENGGFGEHPGHPSDVFTTYCAVLALYMLKALPSAIDRCIGYLKNCQNKDGGFGDVPGYRSDLWHTNLSVISLHVLGVLPKKVSACNQFILACRNNDGSYRLRPGDPAEVYSTHRAISTFFMLGKQLQNRDQTIEWLMHCQSENGGFAYRPGRACSMIANYHAVAALYLANAWPKNVVGCKEWIAQFQREDGGFGPMGRPSATTDEGFACLQASYILETALDPYWVGLIN